MLEMQVMYGKCSDDEENISKTVVLFASVESQFQQCLVRSAGKEQSGAVVRRARLFDSPPCCVVNVQVQVEGVVLIVPNC